MHTSKTPPLTAEWCAGFDQGVAMGTRQLRTALLSRVAILQSDVRLGLRNWNASTVLEELSVLISTLDIEEEHER